MLSSLLLLSAIQASQDAPVTLTIRASRLENAVPAIATATGLNLKVDEEIEDLVIIVKVRDRPAKSLLRIVAEQVNARWVEQDDGALLLRRLPADIRLRETQQRALERQGLQSLVTKLRKETGDGVFAFEDVEKFVAEVDRTSRPPANGVGMSLDGPRLASPASLLAKQLLLSVDPDELLKIKSGEKLRLSDIPMRRQTQMNSEALAAVDQFWKNTVTFVRLKSALLEAGRGSGFDRALLALEMPQSGRGKTIASISRIRGSLGASVAVYAADQTRFTGGFMLSIPLLPPGKIPAHLTRGVKTKHRLSEESALVRRFMLGKYWFGGQYDEDSEESRVMKILRDPENQDPLSFMATDAFFAWADEAGLELVAHLPAFFDRYLAQVEWQEELDLADLWLTLSTVRTLQVEGRDGVLRVRPLVDFHSFMDKGWAKRLGEYRRGIASIGNRLNATAKFCASNWEQAGKASLGQTEMSNWARAGMGTDNWRFPDTMAAMAFWHYLPKSSRDLVGTGIWLEAGTLPAKITKLLDDTVGRRAWTSDTIPSDHLRMVPEEHFPSGLPDSMRIEFEIAQDVLIATLRDAKFMDGKVRTVFSQARLSVLEPLANDPDRRRKFIPHFYNFPDVTLSCYARTDYLTMRLSVPDGSYVTLKFARQMERYKTSDLKLDDLVRQLSGSGGR
ncbi:MAG: hypothetical protein IH944_08900 [Armatimonadetes bacterium]|nr:hypothetical protein [Armatimonadota bacterium]